MNEWIFKGIDLASNVDWKWTDRRLICFRLFFFFFFFFFFNTDGGFFHSFSLDLNFELIAKSSK